MKKKLVLLGVTVTVLSMVASCKMPPRPSEFKTAESCVAAGYEWEMNPTNPQGHCESD